MKDNLSHSLISLVKKNIGDLHLDASLLELIFRKAMKYHKETLDNPQKLEEVIEAPKIEPPLPIKQDGWFLEPTKEEIKPIQSKNNGYKQNFKDYMKTIPFEAHIINFEFKTPSFFHRTRSAFKKIQKALIDGEIKALTATDIVLFLQNHRFQEKSKKEYLQSIRFIYSTLKEKGLIYTSSGWDQEILGL